MPDIAVDRLEALARAIIAAMGASEREIEEVSSHLIRANLAGHDSHGVGMLPDYARLCRDKLLVPQQELKTISDKGAILHFDAGRGFGQVMAREAMRRAIAKAKEQGAVIVALRNSAHLGRIGTYAEQCADEGLASIHFVNVGDHDPHQAPWGCGDARLGTNPFAAAVPMPEGRFVLDMATSAIAFGKARVARNKGVPVPAGTVIDAKGAPTTDPLPLVDRHEGALLAFGLHKGSGLAILCELLGGGLTGGMTIQPKHPRDGGIINSMLSILIEPAALGDPDRIAREWLDIGQWVKAAPPAAGFEEVLLPGEPEARTGEARRKTGIPVDDKTLADVLEAGVSLGADRAQLQAIVQG